MCLAGEKANAVVVLRKTDHRCRVTASRSPEVVSRRNRGPSYRPDKHCQRRPG
jgi:hypothetical protein